MVHATMREHNVCTITGSPGTGKTSKLPIEFLGALMHCSQESHGIAVLMNRKEAQYTVYDHICDKAPFLQDW
eukprot:6436640-Karenia_brevis.AAC.1